MLFKILFIIFLFLFILIDFKSRGYIHNFIIKFIFCIPYAIKDFILLNKKEFRGYGFHIFCGLGGSGKTVSIVNYLLNMKEKYPKLKIYTNFFFLKLTVILKIGMTCLTLLITKKLKLMKKNIENYVF